MAQQDVLDYIRKTPHNSNVNVVKGMLNAEGGGGSSDFSTATMTLNTNTECEITAPIYNGSFIMSKYVFRTSAEVPVVLAPQGTIITINTSGTISVSGDIQIAGEGYGITGDCTITISDGK